MTYATEVSRDFRAEVISHTEVAPEHFILTLRPTTIPPEPRPGQFYLLGVGEGLDPLLKRPLGFFNKQGDDIQFLYRVRGRGTLMLSAFKPGFMLPVLGPLGNGWPMPKEDQQPVVIAGGTAIAAVFPLIKTLSKRAIVIYGARSEAELIAVKELKKYAKHLHTVTEDGVGAKRGTVIDALANVSREKWILYICGPHGMNSAIYEHIADFPNRNSIEAYVSLEEYMACGIGACMGCVRETTNGYQRVCKDGPVFPLDEVIIEKPKRRCQ